MKLFSESHHNSFSSLLLLLLHTLQGFKQNVAYRQAELKKVYAIVIIPDHEAYTTSTQSKEMLTRIDRCICGYLCDFYTKNSGLKEFYLKTDACSFAKRLVCIWTDSRNVTEYKFQHRKKQFLFANDFRWSGSHSLPLPEQQQRQKYQNPDIGKLCILSVFSFAEVKLNNCCIICSDIVLICILCRF